MTDSGKEKRYQGQINKIVFIKGLTAKSKPKKGEHNQAKIDKTNSAAARKKLREAGKSSEYKTKKIKLHKPK